VLVLRSEGARSQLLNRQEVRDRLLELIREATFVPKKRKPTKPSKAAKARRMEGKAKRATVKSLRGKVFD
jgi:ribosome-associated protein